MGFLHLPNELLSIITSLSRPESFESLVLTCKRCWNLGRPFLEHHNRLRRRYKNFRYGKPYAGDNTQRVFNCAQLLCRISQEPLIAIYIVHADLCCSEGNFRLRETNGVKRLLQESPYLKGVDQKIDEWYKKILENVNLRVHGRID